MGMSDLRFVPSSCATTPIDWTKVPEASKKFLLENYGTYYDYEGDTEADSDSEEDTEADSHSVGDTESNADSDGSMKTCPLPATIDDLAKMIHTNKFFGYVTPEVCKLLLDISEFGLAKPRPTKTIGRPVGPRFYMKSHSQIWFVLFVPGCRDGITGHSSKIPDTEDSYEDAGIARDKALAEDYDAKLCKEVRRIGTAGVVTSKKVAGWQSSTLKGTLQFAQLTEAIMELPMDHPAYVNMIQGFRPFWFSG